MTTITENTQIEDEDKGGEIENPFNPKDIKIEIKQLSLDNILKRLKHDEISFMADYQRSPNLWNANKQSLLIESLLLQLPLPAFYFDVRDDDKWEVIDGLQRLSSIKNFVVKEKEPLKLENLEYLAQYNNCGFKDIPRALQRTIEEANITVYLLQKGTPAEVRFNIYKRINTGGLPLTLQEIRHAINSGKPAQLVQELGSILVPLFNERAGKIIPTYRQEDRDFATRFVAFYLIKPSDYKSELETFLNAGMKKINELTSTELKDLKDNFERTLILLFNIFGEFAFQKRTHFEERRKPINKALFEAMTVQFSQCDEAQRSVLLSKKQKVQEEFFKCMQDDVFVKAISTSTGDKKAVMIRHDKIQSVIQKLLNS